MQRFLAAGAGLLATLALAGQSLAADLPPRGAPAPYMMPPAYNWTGWYVGLSGGGAWGDSSWDSAVAPTGTFDVSGGLFGGTLGYNFQSGPAVFGLEGDLSWSDISGSTNANCPTGCETSNSWLATVRGRLGYAANTFMPYVTGGVAFGDIEASRPGFSGASKTRTGWTLGAGVEFALMNNWTAKVEYLYVDLGKFDCGFACGAVAPDNVHFDTNIVRGGINYRF